MAANKILFCSLRSRYLRHIPLRFSIFSFGFPQIEKRACSVQRKNCRKLVWGVSCVKEEQLCFSELWKDTCRRVEKGIQYVLKFKGNFLKISYFWLFSLHLHRHVWYWSSINIVALFCEVWSLWSCGNGNRSKKKILQL